MARIPKGQSFSVYSSPSFKFWFDEKWYTVQGAETMLHTGTKDDISTMRSEYTRMRDVAQKRIQRMQKEFGWTKTAQRKTEIVDETGKVTISYSGFAKLKDIRPEDFAKAFSDLAKFVRAKGSTVTGQREIRSKTRKQFAKNGVNVSEPEYPYFIHVLDEARNLKRVYGSDKVKETADLMMEMSDKPGFDEDAFLDNLSKLLPNTHRFSELEEKVEKLISDGQYAPVNFDKLLQEIGW